MPVRSAFRTLTPQPDRPRPAVARAAAVRDRAGTWSRGAGPKFIMVVADPKTPGSPAIDHAAHLARVHDAELLVCAVLGLPVGETVRYADYPREVRTPADVRRHERAMLDRHRARLERRGHSVQAELLVGVPHDVIARTVEARGVDFVVKQAMCVPEDREPSCGRCDATDRALMGRCPVPVFVERGRTWSARRRAVAVTHGGRAPRRFDASAEVETAARLLRQAGFETRAHDLGGDASAPEGRSVLKRLFGAAADSVSERGFLDAVASVAVDHGADTIVAPNVSAPGPWRALGANPALRLLEWTDYSVLGVKPR